MNLIYKLMLFTILSAPAHAIAPAICKPILTLKPKAKNVDPLKALALSQLNDLREYLKSPSIRDRKTLNETIQKIWVMQNKYVRYNNDAAAESHDLLLCPLAENYIGEDLGFSKNQQVDRSQKLIRYETQNKFLVTVRNGFIYRDNTKLFDRQRYGYVMSENSSIYIFDRPSREGLRESSFVLGMPVAAAGTISFDRDGRVAVITRLSSRYRPFRRNLRQFVLKLRELGVDLSEANIVE